MVDPTATETATGSRWTPVDSGLYARTNWKNCVIRKMNPNSVKNASVTVAFFTLFGFIFLMTQFFQFVRAYSPLSTGVHLLPVAVSVAVGSTIGTRLAVRVGTKAIVTAGLVLQAAFYFWVASDISPALSYGVIAIQMVVYGLGMGLT